MVAIVERLARYAADQHRLGDDIDFSPVWSAGPEVAWTRDQFDAVNRMMERVAREIKAYFTGEMTLPKPSRLGPVDRNAMAHIRKTRKKAMKQAPSTETAKVAFERRNKKAQKEFNKKYPEILPLPAKVLRDVNARMRGDVGSLPKKRKAAKKAA